MVCGTLKLAIILAVIIGCTCHSYNIKTQQKTDASEHRSVRTARVKSEKSDAGKQQKTSGNKEQVPPAEHISSCYDLKASQPSGQYMMTVRNSTFAVYCEQQLNDGGWTVIQNRYDGSVDFNRNWTDYRRGFGNLSGEFWLGLKPIFLLTSSEEYELMVLLEDFNGNSAKISYSKFEISSNCHDYELILAESASIMDGLSYHKGRKFSTYDRDNDSDDNRNCAELAQSGWWHNCYEWSNLNGVYDNGHESHGHNTFSPLMTWWKFGKYNGLKKSKMMIREVGC